MVKNSIYLLLILLLYGCAGQPAQESISFPAGNHTVDEIKTRIVQGAISDGWSIERESDHIITIVKENKSGAATLFLSTRYDSRVMWRDTINIVQNNGRIFLSIHEDNVSNYGTAFERRTPTNGGSQAIMKIKAELDKFGYYTQASNSTKRPVTTPSNHGW